MTFASMAGAFAANNTALLGLSVDSNQSHIDWSRAMERYSWNGINQPSIPFPIVADDMGETARLYGMLMPSSSATRTVRAVFVIDPEGTVRAILAYPLTTGRNIREILRLVMALQAHDRTGNMTPAHWVPGDPMLLPAPQTLPLASQRAENGASGAHCLDWYLCFTQGGNANAANNMGAANVQNAPNMPGMTGMPGNLNIPNAPGAPNVSGMAGMARPAVPAQPLMPEKPPQPMPMPNLMPQAQTFPAPPMQPIVLAPMPAVKPMAPNASFVPNAALAPNAPPVPTPYGIPAAPGAALPSGMPSVPSADWMSAKPRAKTGAEKNKSLSMDEIMKMLEEVGLAGDLPKLDGNAAQQNAAPAPNANMGKMPAVPMPNPAQQNAQAKEMPMPIAPPMPKPAEKPKGNAANTEKPAAKPAQKEGPAGGIMEQNRMLFGMNSKEPEEHMITRDYPYKKR